MSDEFDFPMEDPMGDPGLGIDMTNGGVGDLGGGSGGGAGGGAGGAGGEDGEFTRSIDFLLDIPLEVSVELGRCRMLINDLLKLSQGAVVELAKLAGEPLDILVNSKLIARGEAVVVNEKFGVRLTDVVSPLERIEQLRD